MSDTSLEHIRHSLAHLLAATVLELYPEAKPTIGPSIENGFYYDFEFPTPIGENDLPKIEKKMREILKSWETFKKIDVTPREAATIFETNPYKRELVKELEEKKESITLYYSGPKKSAPDLTRLLDTGSASLAVGFLDLCRGGHVEHPAKDILADSFKLDRLAGAYWRGDEKNTMLTRIYGLAFRTKDELTSYLAMREEAIKRDHKKLGKELGLFVFSELVGPGLPLWTPKGTIVRNLLDDFVWHLRKAKGYEKVTIPHITKKNLYETSGHWKKFAGELFTIKTREDKLFALKPMNCPHHTQIFASEPRSYRDMPIRYAETTMVYRDEQSGELSGLSRVLSITQDDAHVFCRKSQIEAEFFAIWDIVDAFYGAFGFNDLTIRLSRHDPLHFEKYIGDADVWQNAEATMTSLIKKRGIKNYIDGVGEAAMYGPKVDFIAKDSLGRTLQVATIQLDFNMPKNFGLIFMNEEGKKEDVIMIHCAIMGSIERFMATILEHFAGKFPVWLAPVQIKIVPVSEKHHAYAKEIVSALQTNELRVELDLSNESLGKKVRLAKIEKIPYFIVIGEKEMASGMVTLESRDHGAVGQMTLQDLVQKITSEVKQKTFFL